MPIKFTISKRLAGFCDTTVEEGQKGSVIYRELIGPADSSLVLRLDQLHSSLFSKIPELPSPPRLGLLVVVINPDLTAIAYADELSVKAMAKPNRAVEKGEPVFLHDLSDIQSVDLGIDIPQESALVVVNSFLWKRSLFYDFGPLLHEPRVREYDLNRVLAEQLLLLYGLPAFQEALDVGQSRIETMETAIAELEALLTGKCEKEGIYQQLLERHPWMLGSTYSLSRHEKMDDQNIPDFTAQRAYDKCLDIVELKQPFLSLFKGDGTFAADFNDSWNQCERYLDFCYKQRTYLAEEKGLRFENPRCILLMGLNVTSANQKDIRTKEGMNRLITIITYDQLLEQARHVLEWVRSIGNRVDPQLSV